MVRDHEWKRPRMTRQIRMSFVAVVAAALAILGIAVPSAAGAAEENLGWLRMSPPAGASDVPATVLTEGACPSSAKALIVELSGPGVPENNRVGNMVGVTLISVLKRTESGQLMVPLSMVFGDWFLLNSVDRVNGKPYTLSLVCRDVVSPRKTFGAFTGQVVFDAKGSFRAVGEAAKPFNTQLLDPEGDAVDGGAAPVDPAETPSAITTPSSDPTVPEATQSAGAQPSGGATPGGITTNPSTAAAAPGSSAVTPTESTGGPNGSLLLLGLALIAAVGIAVALLRRSRSSTDPQAADDREPATSDR